MATISFPANTRMVWRAENPAYDLHFIIPAGTYPIETKQDMGRIYYAVPIEPKATHSMAAKVKYDVPLGKITSALRSDLYILEDDTDGRDRCPLAMVDQLIEELDYIKVLLGDEEYDEAADELEAQSGTVSTILATLRNGGES